MIFPWSHFIPGSVKKIQGVGEGEVQLVLAYLPRRRLRWSTVCPGVWIALKKYQKSVKYSRMNHNMISKLKYSERPMKIRRKPWTKGRSKWHMINWYDGWIDWLIDWYVSTSQQLIDWLIDQTTWTLIKLSCVPSFDCLYDCWMRNDLLVRNNNHPRKSARKIRTHLMVTPSAVTRSPSPRWSHCKPSSSFRNFLTCGSVTVHPDDKTPANPPTWSECQCVKIMCEIRAFSSARNAFRLVKYSEFPFSPASIKILL